MKLISLNCEAQKHLDLIVPFLQQQKPDVFCFQEIFVDDFEMLKNVLGMDGFHVPIAKIIEPNQFGIEPKGLWGVGILSKLPFASQHSAYYKGIAENIPAYVDGQPNSLNRALAWATITNDGEEFTVATTHFTWSMGGESTPEQMRDLAALQEILNTIPEFVLCGDFNAPRGRATFDTLAAKYTDNIPASVTSTLDPNLHRVKGKALMIDVLFTTPEFIAKDVEVICGVSDHCAVKAEIDRKS